MLEQHRDLNIGNKWILAGKVFEPVAESLQDLVSNTNPINKRFLAVASYGGFPLALLAEGAKYVLSFDVDPGKIGWNHFIKASIQSLEYEENLAFFRCQMDSATLEAVRGRVSPLIPVEHREAGLERMLIFHLCYPHLAHRVASLYPHLKDEQTYQRVKTAVINGEWDIRQEELLDLLRTYAIEDGSKFDAMYVSSIRNWVLDIRYHGDVKRFEAEYDNRLGTLVTGLLNRGGIFYEVLISTDGFPKVRISPRFYPGLDIQEFASSDPNSATRVVVGTKVAN